ncbi:ferrous iron transport protein B, partial [bacterium E08(2017)]
VGGVLVFLPNIMLLFMAVAVLEYSGYMARAAFVVDRLMHKIGLHGKSFIPMLIGFGCSVPAIMATRTLDSQRNRLVTMLIVPLMSCGARLPIYALIIPAFFPEKLHGFMMFLMYFIGIGLAILCAKLLGMFVFKETTPGLVMELPPYRMPTVRCVVVHMWERARLYLKKAGTLILMVSVIMWALSTYPEKKVFDEGMTPEQMQAEKIEHSTAGRIGRLMEPVIMPMGFDWKIGTALIGAVAAKELFVSQLGVVYAVGEADEESAPLRDILKAEYDPLTGFCIMLFCLIGFPCVATCAVTKAESGSWKFAAAQFWGLTLLAYLVTTIVYQIGSLLLG